MENISEELKSKKLKRISEIAESLPEEKLVEVIDFMEFIKPKSSDKTEKEDREWLDSALKSWPEYDWGSEGPPKGRPVKYIPGKGLIVEGGRPDD